MAIEIDRILRSAISRGASDIHILPGSAPRIRINGTIRCLDTPGLTPSETDSLMKGCTPNVNRVELETSGGTNFGFAFEGHRDRPRFRVNAFKAQGNTCMVLRRLPSKLFLPDQLGLPKELVDLSYHARGFIPVTGPTGSGKSTTLAALAWNLVREHAINVIMIEDPTEYVIPNGKGHVYQRTVGVDVESFEEGVYEALREDPDVVIVGEMRRLKTIEAAISAAETGHLVMGTLHTTTAHRTVDRIINPFPASEQAYIRSVLSESLLGVVCQQLLPRADDSGVIAAFEFMRATSAIQNHIREGDTFKIVSAMQTGGKHGMRLLDADLARLVRTGVVDLSDAIKKANNPSSFAKVLREEAEGE